MNKRRGESGVTLIEVLVGIVVVTMAAAGALSFFTYGNAGIQDKSQSRAALEQASSRIELLMAENADNISPPDSAVRWLSCAGTPCTWTLSPTQVTETVPVNGVGSPMRTTVQWVHDPSAGTHAGTRDVLQLAAKVWFSPTTTDDNFHRIEMRTLRKP